MVLYFTSDVVDPPVKLYMGRDKEENEELIRWGWPEDVWFHVDKLSSAHVYLRLQPGQTINDIPEKLIKDCCQLVKANSIEVHIEKRINDIVNRLNKTKIVDDNVNFQAEREKRDAEENRKLREEQRAHRNRENIEREAKQREKEARSYDRIFAAEKMKTNKDEGNESDDFM